MEDQQYVWGIWQDAFCKFGYADGDGKVLTPQVETVLEQAGYDVRYGQWGCHNLLIYSVMHNDMEFIPKSSVGYQRPDDYLPNEVIALMDKAFPSVSALPPKFSALDQEPD